jgi:hypothetical protein
MRLATKTLGGHFKTKELAFEIYKLSSSFMFEEFKNYVEYE